MYKFEMKNFEIDFEKSEVSLENIESHLQNHMWKCFVPFLIIVNCSPGLL